MSCKPKPDVVSSTAYHADTDNDYDVDTDDESVFKKTLVAKDKDKRPLNPPLKNASTPTHKSTNRKESENGGGKKREGVRGGEEIKKRHRADSFEIDLTDVPTQLPILKTRPWAQEMSSKFVGPSKYEGVSFDKSMKKWMARIKIKGKQHHIGFYENEGEAAVDSARALLKYKGQKALAAIDLTGVPPQPPKYAGVSFEKAFNKWEAKITIEGKLRHIGYYENKEEAAIDYARAEFKYTPWRTLGWRFEIDLSDVPSIPPIPKCERDITEKSSKYAGVYLNGSSNKYYSKIIVSTDKKWCAKISVDGKQHTIGYYENEEEAAIDYARAVFKYKGQDALDKAREAIDLSGVPSQLPILKGIKEGSSKYIGVSFDKTRNKWRMKIMIDGKERTIGLYENESDAATDYARAVFKYQGQDALDKIRKQNSLTSGVPPMPPIPKYKGRIKEGPSKYAGVTFSKPRNKWQAKITIDYKQHHIGWYENEKEAAIDYARALFKYKGVSVYASAIRRSAAKP